MKEITRKIAKDALNGFRPTAESMAQRGCSKDEIVKFFQAQVRVKTQERYNALREPQSIQKIFGSMDLRQKDSKAEAIFYDLMKDAEIDFGFQSEIGPYKADYLIDDSIVVELDGPMHLQGHDDKKDKYLRKMGYKVIRVPLWILGMDPEAAIETIKEAMGAV